MSYKVQRAAMFNQISVNAYIISEMFTYFGKLLFSLDKYTMGLYFIITW